MDDMKVQLSVLMELLQESVKCHRNGWNMKKNINWFVKQLYVKKLRNIMNVLIKS